MPYIANLTPKDGVPLNVEPLEVEIIADYGDDVEVRTAQGATKRVKRELIWDNELQARIRGRRTRYNFLCKKVGQALIDGELPADPLCLGGNGEALRKRFTNTPVGDRP